MPLITSAKQYGFMQAARAGKLRASQGPSPEQAEKMIHETPPAKRSVFSRALAHVRKRRGGGY